MAKDDYNVIVFKILVYYYGILKRKVEFEQIAFDYLIDKDSVNSDYFNDVLIMIANEGLISGVSIIVENGTFRISTNHLHDINITHKGVQYIEENSKMKEVKKCLSEVPGAVSELIKIVLMA